MLKRRKVNSVVFPPCRKALSVHERIIFDAAIRLMQAVLCTVVHRELVFYVEGQYKKTNRFLLIPKLK